MMGKNQQRWQNSVVSGVAQCCIRKFKKPHALATTPASGRNACSLDRANVHQPSYIYICTLPAYVNSKQIFTHTHAYELTHQPYRKATRLRLQPRWHDSHILIEITLFLRHNAVNTCSRLPAKAERIGIAPAAQLCWYTDDCLYIYTHSYIHT